jgi:hypothetical protein
MELESLLRVKRTTAPIRKCWWNSELAISVVQTSRDNAASPFSDYQYSKCAWFRSINYSNLKKVVAATWEK